MTVSGALPALILNMGDINWADIQMLLDDEEVVFAVLEHHLNVLAAVIDEEFIRGNNVLAKVRLVSFAPLSLVSN